MDSKTINNYSLSKELGVSHPTIGRWIADAIDGKNNLQIKSYKDKYQVVENEHNKAELLKLKENAAKYRNKNSYVRIKADPKLYKTGYESEIIKLIQNIEEKREIPFQTALNYCSQTQANQYLAYSKDREQNLDILLPTLDYLSIRLGEIKNINLVDISSSGISEIDSIIRFLGEKNYNLSYTAATQSPIISLLKDRIIQENYPKIKVKSEATSFSNISEMLFLNYLSLPHSINIITLLELNQGSASGKSNLYSQLFSQLSGNDIFVVSSRLNTILNRTDFDIAETSIIKEVIYKIPKLLGLTTDLYEKINRYDSEIKSKTQILKLKKDVDLVFEIFDQEKIVKFTEGDELKIWIESDSDDHQLNSILSNAGFKVLYSAISLDYNSSIKICIK